MFGHNPEAILESEETRTAAKETLHEETGCVVAVRDVSFKVNKGELFVIMGLSGSGKSTLIRCVLRLIEPTAGKILINGEDVCGYDNKQLINLRRHSTGMIFQHFGLFPHRSVLDNAAYGLKVRGVAKEKRYEIAREVLNKVGLKGWENYLPSALSGGMQQRVGIARALANDPDILLMDEPFSGLDPLIRRQMQDELIALQSEVHKTILFVTHDLDEALKLGNHVAIMKDGDIIQMGTPEEVITSPINGYVRSFVQDASPTKVVTASSIMEQPNVLLYEWQGPKAAMHLLRTNHLDEVFMVDRAGKLRGLVTLERLIELFRKGEESLAGAVDTDFVTATADAVLEDLFPLAASTGHPIAVVDEDGKFLGEIFDSTIMISLIQGRGEEDTGSTTTRANGKDENL
ncbi:MAG: glycine betaine/L-proline ABC transporter ATP-binding protein [Dehalococcoidales bacterium]|nr:glycine betaine/L-proline ABC transporter ATP-binding protein [Dehalococcoidales bacterium]